MLILRVRTGAAGFPDRCAGAIERHHPRGSCRRRQPVYSTPQTLYECHRTLSHSMALDLRHQTIFAVSALQPKRVLKACTGSVTPCFTHPRIFRHVRADTCVHAFASPSRIEGASL